MRPRRFNDKWDWKISSYSDRDLRHFCAETVHQGEQSKNMELAVIESLGCYARVTNLRTGGVEILEPGPMPTVVDRRARAVPPPEDTT